MNKFFRLTSIAALLMLCFTLHTNARPMTDDEEAETEVYRLEDLPRVKMDVMPRLEGKADVLGFFDAINESFYIEQWQVAHVYLHPEEDEGLGDNCAWETVLDKKNGYLRVSFGVAERNPNKNFVECAYWNMKNGSKLVVLNFDYEQKEDDQIFSKGKAHDILFYRYDPEYSEWHRSLQEGLGGELPCQGPRGAGQRQEARHALSQGRVCRTMVRRPHHWLQRPRAPFR